MNPLHVSIRLIHGPRSRIRNVWFRASGVQIRGYVWLRRVSKPRNWSDITIEGPTALDDGVVLLAIGAPHRNTILIGSGCYINRFAMIDVSKQIEIGRDCMIGPYCYIPDSDHGHARGTPIASQPGVVKPVRIGNNVRIGAGAIILKAVTEDDAVIGTGVVKRDGPAASKVAVVPVRQIGQRE